MTKKLDLNATFNNDMQQITNKEENQYDGKELDQMR